MRMSVLSYCDYIAHQIKEKLKADDQLIAEVGRVQLHLSEEGYFASTRKQIETADVNGKKYLITVEEIV